MNGASRSAARLAGASAAPLAVAPVMVAVMLAVMTAVFGAGVRLAPSAAAGAGSNYQMSMNPTAGEPGTLVTFTSITPCIEGLVVNLGVMPNPTGGDILATGPVDFDGHWSLSYTIPAATPPGPLDFYVTCEGGVEVLGVEQRASSSSELRLSPFAVGGVISLGPVYGPLTFTVTSPATTTTSSSTTSSSTTSSSTTSTVPSTTVPPTSTTLPGPSVTLSPSSVPQGGQVTVTSTGWKPGSMVQITLNSDPLDVGTAIADQVGAIVHTFTVPSNFLAGVHSVTLTGLDLAGRVQVLSADLEVTALAGVVNSIAQTGESATGPLPRTGSSIVVPLAIVGAGFAVGGAGLAVVSRRRRAAPSSTPSSTAGG